MVRHEVSKKFPLLKDNIFGEEDNKFTNTLGETVEIEVKIVIKSIAQF